MSKCFWLLLLWLISNFRMFSLSLQNIYAYVYVHISTTSWYTEQHIWLVLTWSNEKINRVNKTLIWCIAIGTFRSVSMVNTKREKSSLQTKVGCFSFLYTWRYLDYTFHYDIHLSKLFLLILFGSCIIYHDFLDPTRLLFDFSPEIIWGKFSLPSSITHLNCGSSLENLHKTKLYI